ncbi:MAG: transporter related protein [Gemmatimonadetes bacterium]|nr:transporter related protein [Gemmatimonadota bacterium]
MSANSLVLSGLTRRFGNDGSAAVSDLSLEVKAGELLALIGASGSGKTTTLRMIAGYEIPDEGRVVLRDASGAERDVTREPPQRRGFGMVFQHYALFPHLRVVENVAFGLEARGVGKTERESRARATLDSVGLAHAADRTVQALSGGEQQRVALARALVIEPPVLLLDEPLSNLDPTLREHTREELRSMLHRLGVTAVFVTHDQEDAFAVADRVAILKQGRLQQVGTPQELYRTPASLDVARFVGRGVMLPADVRGDRVSVTIGDVTQQAPLAGNHAEGSVLAVLRPESLALRASDGPGWKGRITARRFAGGHEVYRVALDHSAESIEVTSEQELVEHAGVHVVLRDQPVAVVPAG